MSFKDVLQKIEFVLSLRIVKTALVIAAAIVFYILVSQVLKARSKRLKKLERKRGETLLHLLNSILKYAVLIFCIFMILQVNNVNITSMVAGLGIAGAILGIAVQDALKDIFRGFDIVSDNYFKVGDIIDVKGTEGVVLELGLKTTKIKDLKTGYVISIPNRQIEATGLVSDCVYIEVPLPYETPLEKAESIIGEITEQAKKNANVSDCKYLGVNNLADSSIKYLITVSLKNISKKLQTRRDVLHTVLDVLARNDVCVPYNQIDVHNR
ncbi:MAG: mechanosensitive ion channel [Clostridia bacterium]|nr:mechanosensitive ion channel [Clostridia bacterium]